MFVRSAVIVLGAGVAVAGCASGAAPTPSQSTSATSAAPSTTSGATPVAGTSAAEVWAGASSPLDQARTAQWTQEIRTGPVTKASTVSVDEGVPAMRVETTMAVPGEASMRLVTVATPDRLYLTSPAWTGKRAGRWTATAVEAEPGRPTVSTVPVVAAGFRPAAVRTEAGATVLDGTVDAGTGVRFLGLTGLLKDETWMSTMDGEWPVTARIEKGRLVGMTIHGAGDGVTGTHSAYSADQLREMLGGSEGSITITGVDRPVQVKVPAAGLVDTE